LSDYSDNPLAPMQFPEVPTSYLNTILG